MSSVNESGHYMSRPKIKCEVCGERDVKILEKHHIIPRTDLNCTNDDLNIAVLCASCHSKLHTKSLKIIGVFPSTDPTGFTLVYELYGKKNIDIDEPYLVPQKKEMKIHERKDSKIDGNK